MIGERETYHGIALARLVQKSDRPLRIESLASVSRSAYLLDGTVGIYLKYSTKRLPPWAFEFTAEHATELEKLREIASEQWIVLICGPVGIASASLPQVEEISSRRSDGSYSLSVNWRPNHKFRLAGARSAPLLVADSAFPAAVVGFVD